MDTFTGFVTLIAVLAIVVCLYPLPWLIGRKRGVATLGMLFCFNVLLGWTVLGWLIAMLWGIMGETTQQRAFYANAARGDGQ